MVQKSGEHQLRLVIYPIIYKVLYIPGGDRRISEPSTVWPFFALSLTPEVFSLAILWHLMENIGYLSTNTHGEARQQLKSRSKGDLKAEEPPASLDFKLTLPRKKHAICVGFFHRNQANINYYSLGVSYPVGVFFATSSRKNTKSRLSSKRISNHLPWVEHGKLNAVLILL